VERHIAIPLLLNFLFFLYHICLNIFQTKLTTIACHLWYHLQTTYTAVPSFPKPKYTTNLEFQMMTASKVKVKGFQVLGSLL